MKCPFPGMDPYLESPAVWQNFHNRFITHLGDAIASYLPENYDARVEETIHVVEFPSDNSNMYRPEISITKSTDRAPESDFEGDDGGVAVLIPTAVLRIAEPTLEEVHELRIEIRRWPGNELVTTIELLSPWNKSGEAFVDFRRKRPAVLATDSNWVDIDVLVGGERVAMIGQSPSTDYRVVIARGFAQPSADVFAWNVREALPKIPIPLRHPDRPIPISLAEVFAMTYERSRLDKALRRLPPGPPPARLAKEDLAWATEIARAR